MIYHRGGRWSYKNSRYQKKFQSNFLGLAVSYFQQLCASCSLACFHEAISESCFLATLKVFLIMTPLSNFREKVNLNSPNLSKIHKTCLFQDIIHVVLVVLWSNSSFRQIAEAGQNTKIKENQETHTGQKKNNEIVKSHILKYFQVLVLKFKKLKYIRLAKINTSLTIMK